MSDLTPPSKQLEEKSGSGSRGSTLILIIVFLIVGVAIGCFGIAPALTQPKMQSYEKQITALTSSLSALNATTTNQMNEILTLQSQASNYQNAITDLQNQYSALETQYDLLKNANLSKLRDPTWQELVNFLKADDTEEYRYQTDKFMCLGFATALRDNAFRSGFRCALVQVSFTGGSLGHTLNAFNTVDKGLVYIDDTGNADGTGVDKIAYVLVGRSYGTLSLGEVKTRIIAYELYNSKSFLGGTLTTREVDPLNYEYYLDNQNLLTFYNENVAAYNKAVSAFNQGGGSYTYDQLTAWSNNLETIRDSLGTVSISMGVVQSIELYWN